MPNESTGSLNAAFWNELCGTNTAIKLGLTDGSTRSLQLFDRWFFSFYPYLKPFLDEALVNQDIILEVGLGYGSVSTYLATQKLSYTGMDIAPVAVEMCNSRLSQIEGDHKGIEGNALKAPFPDSNFDAVVAIGSLHHTGDFDGAISEMFRVTKSEGVVCGMVYSLFSARNFIFQPVRTTRLAFRNIRHPMRVKADEKLRWFSDQNQKGEAAPATEYFSRRALRSVLENYGDAQVKAFNVDPLPIPFGSGDKVRKLLIKTKLATWFGLDLYFVVHKKTEIA
jgi:ubiquinone/menaquinone biosynthesis C-methylase UbiE